MAHGVCPKCGRPGQAEHKCLLDQIDDPDILGCHCCPDCTMHCRVAIENLGKAPYKKR